MESLLGLFHKRSVFNLSHEKKFSCDMGYLIPIMCEEVLPGDSFKVTTNLLVRLSPILAPIMHRINVFTHFFFCPNRLAWNEWESFITGGEDGYNASVAPTITINGLTTGTLGDYLGLPLGTANVDVSALPFRCIAKIYNEWYRDQNLQVPKAISYNSGPDATTSTALLLRNWEKDYFTSALPWTQKGAAVQVSMGGNAAVNIPMISPTLGVNQLLVGAKAAGSFTVASTTQFPLGVLASAAIPDGNNAQLSAQQTSPGHVNDEYLEGTADLSTATPISINDLRLAFQVQKWKERNARSGSRYVESNLAHFGVLSSDARLQRPEFLGGGKSPIVISEVLQTSATDDSITDYTPLATMAGHGYSVQKSHEFDKSFEEHGFIIGFLSIMPRTCYQEGLSRMWTRSTRYDYYWPEFAHLGEQAVLKREIYCDGTGTDTAIFGYQGRYDEYRRRESMVCGDFRTTLDHWHMGRIFGAVPSLDDTFIECDATKRPFAVPSEHTCWVQVVNAVKAVRPLPVTGEPGLIDHN